MKKFILGLIIGLLLPGMVVYLYIVSGSMPVATKSHPLPFEEFIAKKALQAALKNDAGRQPPISANESNFLAGVKVYKTQCAVCHGLPNQHKTPIALGLFPKPPQLFDGDGVTDDPAGETYWKVKNGIRLTGMPGFESALTDAEMWSVSLLLSKATELPDSVKSELNHP